MFDLLRCCSLVVRGTLSVALLSGAARAGAADWDHDANIDAAIDGFAAAFRGARSAGHSPLKPECIDADLPSALRPPIDHPPPE